MLKRLLTKEKPVITNKPDDKFETMLFLPEGECRQGEGGLRTRGYFKHSYKLVDGEWFIVDIDNNPVIPAPEDIQSKINQYMKLNTQSQTPVTDLPLITVITVVYNGVKYLEETIQSVINQTYPNVEYIIIDGGSTDGTVDIIKKYEDYIDYWVSERDKGIYDAMNKGIMCSTGEIIGIINADDYLYSKTLFNVVHVFIKNKIDYIYGCLDLISKDGIKLKTVCSFGINHFKYKIFKHMPFLHPTLFIKHFVYKKIGLFNTIYTLSGDYDFELRLLKSYYKGMNSNIVTGVFRLGGKSGGISTYRENHQLLLKHGVSPIIVYVNSIVLITKLIIRNIFNRIKQLYNGAQKLDRVIR